MGIRRTRHAVYDLKYHFVWVPKYRANVLGGEEVVRYLKEVMEDHVHLFIEAPPSYSPARLVQAIKSISAKELYKRFPEMRKKMWSGKMWSEGYFVRSVGDKVTADIIRRYIEYQKQEDKGTQLKMFEKR